MEKILVATDLSINSTSAIYFAYRLSQLKGATLVIVHVYHFLKPKSWRSHRFENYHEARKKVILARLNKFLERIIGSIDASAVDFEIDLQMNSNIVNTILKCIAKHKCTYMCIGMNGGGKEKKIIGASATKLIIKAPIPVFSIPSSYKAKSIDSICYVSDMSNYQKEIIKIIELANAIQLEISILHIASPFELLPPTKLLAARLFRRTGVSIKIKYARSNSTNTLIEDIDIAIKKIRPSIIAFFINKTDLYLSPTFYTPSIPSLSLFKKHPVLTYKK